MGPGFELVLMKNWMRNPHPIQRQKQLCEHTHSVHYITAARLDHLMDIYAPSSSPGPYLPECRGRVEIWRIERQNN